MILEKWQQLREKAADLTLRERMILAGTFIVVLVIVWAQFFLTPYDKKNEQLGKELQTLQLESAENANRLMELTALLANDPNEPLRREQQRLNEAMNTLKQEIETRLSGLIAPEEMAGILRQVLADYKGLQLVSARNLPVEPLDIKKALGGKSELGDAHEAVIFAHGFELVLTGEYFQTLRFLQALEQTKGFYWRMLDYEVTGYPNASVTLQISTLSLDEDWIGV